MTSLSTIAGACPVRRKPWTSRPRRAPAARTRSDRRDPACGRSARRRRRSVAVAAAGSTRDHVTREAARAGRAAGCWAASAPRARPCLRRPPQGRRRSPCRSSPVQRPARAAPERLGVPVLARVDELALEHMTAAPVGDDRLLLVAGGGDHLGRAQLAGRGRDRPVRRRRGRPLDAASRAGARSLLAWRGARGAR